MAAAQHARLAAWACAVIAVLPGCRESDGGLRAWGTVEAREYRIASRVGGRVADVGPEEGDRVRADEVIVALDLAELDRQREQAQAALAAAESREQLLIRGARAEDVTAARKALSAAIIREQQAERDVRRAETLVSGSAAPRMTLDDARTALNLARSEVATRRAQLEKLVGGARPEELAAAAAAREEAAAALAGIDERLEDRELKSPIDGVVIHRLIEPDEIARPGAPLLVVGDLAQPYVDVYVPEPHVDRAQPGRVVEVVVDALPGMTFRGVVRHLAAEAEFTPKNVQTADQRARLVYRTRVDVQDPRGLLLPGMPASALFPAPGGGEDGGASR